MANAKRSKRRTVWVLLVLGLLGTGGGVWAWLRTREPVIIVQTEPVTRRNLTEVVVANGRIQPVVQVVIAPEVSGEIIDLPVKEGQQVKKGEVLVRIKPDNYLAQRRSAEATYQSALASSNLARANLDKAQFEFKRIQQLFESKLVSDSQFDEAKTALAVAQASFETSTHQVEQARAALARAEDDLAKTTILAPMDGTVTRLRSQKGERVVGTALMAGTEIMTLANLDDMEARVEVGEVDIVLIALGQKARLEVDAFRDRQFHGTVTEIANAAKGLGSGSAAAAAASAQQEATKFEVKIRIQEKEAFRPGMSVTAEIETRFRTNVLTVPIQSVTTRPPKKRETQPGSPNHASANSPRASSGNPAGAEGSRKPAEAAKPIEVVFVVEGDRVKMVPVKRGISDDRWVEIVEGLQEGQEVVSGGYKAINRDLQDGSKIKKGQPVEEENEADKPR
jgi:HlyD family secretion protein